MSKCTISVAGLSLKAPNRFWTGACFNFDAWRMAKRLSGKKKFPVMKGNGAERQIYIAVCVSVYVHKLNSDQQPPNQEQAPRWEDLQFGENSIRNECSLNFQLELMVTRKRHLCSLSQ